MPPSSGSNCAIQTSVNDHRRWWAIHGCPMCKLAHEFEKARAGMGFGAKCAQFSGFTKTKEGGPVGPREACFLRDCSHTFARSSPRRTRKKNVNRRRSGDTLCGRICIVAAFPNEQRMNYLGDKTLRKISGETVAMLSDSFWFKLGDVHTAIVLFSQAHSRMICARKYQYLESSTASRVFCRTL